MAIKILSQEVHFIETNNNVSVRTTVPKELLEDGVLLMPHVRRMALPADTDIKVSIMSRDYDVVFHVATFRVWKAVVTQKRVLDDDGRGERAVRHTDYLIGRVGEWEDSPEIEPALIDAPSDIPVEEALDPTPDIPSELKRRPGRPRKDEAA